MFESQMRLITLKMEVPFPRYELTCFIYFKPNLHWRLYVKNVRETARESARNHPSPIDLATLGEVTQNRDNPTCVTHRHLRIYRLLNGTHRLPCLLH